MAGFLCKYGRLFASILLFFSLTIVVITGLAIGSFITLAAYAYNNFLIDTLECTPLILG